MEPASLSKAGLAKAGPKPLDAAGLKRVRARGRMRLRLYVFLAGLDSLLLILSFVAAGWIRFNDLTDRHAFILGNIFLIVYLVAALNLHAYSVTILEKPVRAAKSAIQALALAAVIVMGLAFFLKVGAEISRLTLAMGAGMAGASIATARLLVASNIKKAFGETPYSVVTIHDEVHDGAGTSRVYVNGHPLRLEPGEYLDPARQEPEMYDRLANILQGADRAVIFCPPERRLPWTQVLKGACVQGEIVAPELRAFSALGISSVGGSPTLVVSHGPLGLADRIVKRLLDLTVAGSGLLILSPLLLLVALLIKLDTPGPVFFVQPRIGEGNKMFNVLKFRSMRTDLGDMRGERSTGRDDDRITRVGRILRKTSIDELPQLINVLRGDMSIVGPRPHAVGSRAADKLFWEIDERYWHRHRIKPGLTGLAQIRGYRGATEVERDLMDRLQSDLEYVNHWSIWRDLKIILLTAKVLFHRNAF